MPTLIRIVLLTAGLLIATLSIAQTTTSAPDTHPATASSRPASQPAGETTVVTVDGNSQAGTLTSLSAQGATLIVAGRAVTIAQGDIQEIQFAQPGPDVMARNDQALILTARGCQLPASEIRVTQGRVTFSTALTGPVGMGIEQVTMILLADVRNAPRTLLEQLDKLALPASAEDCLLVRGKPGEYVPVFGALKAIGDGKVTFNYDREDRTIDLAKVAMIRLAQVAQSAAGPRGIAIGSDGARLAFEGVSMSDGRLRLAGTCAGEVELPVDRLASVQFRSDSVAYLADLKPLAVEQSGTFDLVFEYRRDQSTAGKPLTLDGRVFRHGLGLHSRCKLTYALDGQYRQLVAVAGIDDAVRPAGSVMLSVLADDKPLLPATKLTGKDKALPLRLDLTGAKTLTILVEFGDALDIGDHVDLAEAKLIK